jgi:2-polyprenyl-3-methyl-5-hydroxy-6-metoxy-1,4-benzoquinol methylase
MRNIVSRARRVAKDSVYFLRTGYWHTGERVCPDFPTENFLNHLKLYRFAAQFVTGKKVLDVGCGTGYGSSHLAESASSVTGIDLSSQALHFARARYRKPNLQYLRMNAETLNFPDGSFDFVISTENFEHLGNQEANLREMARILNDDGVLLLSTPNHEMFIGVDNPHHTHELTYEELLAMTGKFFAERRIAENLLEPSTVEGQSMREERKRLGFHGLTLSEDPFLFGKPVDTQLLSNTHSFLCFARKPLRVSST